MNEKILMRKASQFKRFSSEGNEENMSVDENVG